MLQTEANMLIEYMGKLWPKWEYTPDVIALWLEWLTGPLDYGRAKAAVKHYRLNSRFNTPTPAGLKDSLKGFVRDDAEFDGGNGYGEMFIECAAGDCAGRRVPLLYGCNRAIPNEHSIHARAEEMRLTHEETYGGEWRVMRDPGGKIFFGELDKQKELHNG